jgi:hypothetical protein
MGELKPLQIGRAWQFHGLERLLGLLATPLSAQSPNSRSLEESS